MSKIIPFIWSQCSNALFPIDFTDERIVICSNEWQYLKQQDPIDSNDEDSSNIICDNIEHSSKTESPRVLTDLGIVICLSDEHLKKHYLQ